MNIFEQITYQNQIKCFFYLTFNTKLSLVKHSIKIILACVNYA